MGMSQWRGPARRAIEEALAALPVGADYAAKRKALRAAYPFGQREHHPYRVWCDECRKAIGAKATRKAAPLVVLVTPHGVDCDWCRQKEGGCLMCLPVRARWQDRQSTDWSGWARWLNMIAADPGDRLTRLAFADWLDEQSWPGQAAIERGAAEQLSDEVTP